MMPSRSPYICAFALLFAAGCTTFPQLDDSIRPEVRDADYATLVPLSTLQTSTDPIRIDPAQTQAELNGRLAGLRARADRLRGTVLTGREKQRLQEGLQ
ncbi:hypothetical protein [Sulfitobacter mediterraneus]|jgi:hypothetical protein|uniref:hypothetical protein n=2 Tax=Sulfitobacter mediterraneus TaxID=83219 RepID=UPI001EEE889B|nr:hypothetical protein [Sulfitobacter mediterraneus]